MKKNLIKCLIFIPVLLLAAWLGVWLATDFVWWKMALFLAYCCIAGHSIYKCFRLVDSKF